MLVLLSSTNVDALNTLPIGNWAMKISKFNDKAIELNLKINSVDSTGKLAGSLGGASHPISGTWSKNLWKVTFRENCPAQGLCLYPTYTGYIIFEHPCKLTPALPGSGGMTKTGCI